LLAAKLHTFRVCCGQWIATKSLRLGFRVGYPEAHFFAPILDYQL
jgi:hypothetical protein